MQVYSMASSNWFLLSKISLCRNIFGQHLCQFYGREFSYQGKVYMIRCIYRKKIFKLLVKAKLDLIYVTARTILLSVPLPRILVIISLEHLKNFYPTALIYIYSSSHRNMYCLYVVCSWMLMFQLIHYTNYAITWLNRSWLLSMVIIHRVRAVFMTCQIIELHIDCNSKYWYVNTS